MNFEQALDYLFSLGHETLTIKFGLENTENLLAALGQPHHAFPKVQIAGTNGKGSTAVMLESICRAAGIKTGLYTSPHLSNITERVRINGLEISEAGFARLTRQVSEAANKLSSVGQELALPTFFEHLTAITLTAFRDEKVELGILETGLGGRLDATTAACAESVAITPVALDHQEYLGATIEEIAAEKAAIIRSGVTAVIAPQTKTVLDVILKRCAECSVEPILVDHQIQIVDVEKTGRICATFKSNERTYEKVWLGLRGRHQTTNASVAIGIVETLIASGFDIPHDAIIHGLETAEHRGRLELWNGQPSFLFDGAHNVAGAIALREYLDEFVDVPITLLFGAMRDKDLSSMATTLFPAAAHVILTEIDNPRSVSSDDLTDLARSVSVIDRVTVYYNSRDAILAAKQHASSNGLVCVTGSLFLIGEVQDILKRDSTAEARP